MNPIQAYLVEDHARLDALLTRSTASPDALDLEAFDLFRRGLLRHIGIEEKIFFPAVRRTGTDLPEFARLRQDHALLTALLVPTPTREGIAEIRRILQVHNDLEEAGGHVYEQCVALTLAESDGLLERILSAPEVPVRPYSDARRPQLLKRLEDERE